MKMQVYGRISIVIEVTFTKHYLGEIILVYCLIVDEDLERLPIGKEVNRRVDDVLKKKKNKFHLFSVLSVLANSRKGGRFKQFG